MATVAELTELYTNFMRRPRAGPDVCDTCFNFTRGYSRCYACAHNESHLDAVVPISYSVANEQLHHALAQYKRSSGDAARRLQRELAAVLWRFLAAHERCVARAAQTPGFDLVTTVPSSDRSRDELQPLRQIVEEIAPTKRRHRRLLAPTDKRQASRQFDPDRFVAIEQLTGRHILLIDDTWTSGASAQSAAAALKQAGAASVAAVVIGRHLNREWHENDRRLCRLDFDWGRCALCS
jgi:predicted amidophosphoribosyltransferase